MSQLTFRKHIASLVKLRFGGVTGGTGLLPPVGIVHEVQVQFIPGYHSNGGMLHHLLDWTKYPQKLAPPVPYPAVPRGFRPQGLVL